jgi:hypothetical protein
MVHISKPKKSGYGMLSIDLAHHMHAGCMCCVKRGSSGYTRKIVSP